MHVVAEEACFYMPGLFAVSYANRNCCTLILPPAPSSSPRWPAMLLVSMLRCRLSQHSLKEREPQPSGLPHHTHTLQPRPAAAWQESQHAAAVSCRSRQETHRVTSIQNH